jgi:hypothetical protein
MPPVWPVHLACRLERVIEPRPWNFGPQLRAYFCGRFDLVAFKYLELIASTLDDNKTKALGDLRALQPTADERSAAQDWLMNIPKGSQGWKDLVQREMAKM